MPRRYSINGSRTLGSNVTVLGLTSTAAIKPEIIYLCLGSVGTPADNAAEYRLNRYTAAGTSTAVTPQALDPGSPAATASAGENHSAEPTYTSGAVLWRSAKNMRPTLQVYFQEGAGIVLPATASNGVGLLNVSVTTAYAEMATIHYVE